MPKSCLAIGFVLLGVNVAVIFTYPQHLILAQEKGGDNKPQLFHLQKSEHRVIVLPQKNQEAEKLLDTMSNAGMAGRGPCV